MYGSPLRRSCASCLSFGHLVGALDDLQVGLGVNRSHRPEDRLELGVAGAVTATEARQAPRAPASAVAPGATSTARSAVLRHLSSRRSLSPARCLVAVSLYRRRDRHARREPSRPVSACSSACDGVGCAAHRSGCRMPRRRRSIAVAATAGAVRPAPSCPWLRRVHRIDAR